jgi:hypothetical protein
MFIKSDYNDIEIHIDSGIYFEAKKHPINSAVIHESYMKIDKTKVCFSIIKNLNILVIRPFLNEFELAGDIKILAYHFAILIHDSISLFTPEDEISKIFVFDKKLGIVSCLINFPPQSKCQEFIDKVNEIYPKIPGLLALA